MNELPKAKKKMGTIDQALYEAMTAAGKKKEKQGKTCPNSMGHNPILFNSATIFPRQFRFLVDIKSNKSLAWLVRSFGYSMTDKTIDLDLYDVGDEPNAWLERLSLGEKDFFVVTALDGCGKELYKLAFTDVALVNHESQYDYSSSDVVTHKLKLTYKTRKKST